MAAAVERHVVNGAVGAGADVVADDDVVVSLDGDALAPGAGDDVIADQVAVAVGPAADGGVVGPPGIVVNIVDALAVVGQAHPVILDQVVVGVEVDAALLQRQAAHDVSTVSQVVAQGQVVVGVEPDDDFGAVGPASDLALGVAVNDHLAAFQGRQVRDGLDPPGPRYRGGGDVARIGGRDVELDQHRALSRAQPAGLDQGAAQRAGRFVVRRAGVAGAARAIVGVAGAGDGDDGGVGVGRSRGDGIAHLAVARILSIGVLVPGQTLSRSYSHASHQQRQRENQNHLPHSAIHRNALL